MNSTIRKSMLSVRFFFERSLCFLVVILTSGCVTPHHQSASSPLWAQSFQASRQDLFTGDELPVLTHPAISDGFDSLEDFANAFGFHILGSSEFEYDPLPLDGALDFGKEIGATHVIVFQKLMGSDVENRINTTLIPTTSFQSGSGLALHSGMAFGSGFGLARGPYTYMGSYSGQTTSSYSSTSIQTVPYTYSQRFVHNIYRYYAVYLRRKSNISQDLFLRENPDIIEKLKTSATRGNSWSMLLMAAVSQSGILSETNIVESTSWMMKAADAGNVVAMEELSYRYQSGYGVEQNQETALYWLKLAAQCGSASAMVKYGDILFEKATDPQKMKEAADWWDKGDDAMNPIATFNLGICYLNGTGRRQCASLARTLFSRANARGDSQIFQELKDLAINSNSGRIQYAVAVCLEYGVWTIRNREEAAQWLNQAQQNGCNLILHYPFDWLSFL